MRIRPLIFVAALVLTNPVADVRGQEQPQYALFVLRPLGGPSSYGYGINEFGHVAGSAFLPGNVFHATLWIETEAVDLGTLGGTDSHASDVNSAGWVTGWSNPPGGTGFNRRGFLWRDGQMEDIGSLGGDRVEANGISNTGQIVGWSQVEPGQSLPRHAFRWSEGSMTDLGTLDPRGSSEAQAITNGGDVVGDSIARAVLWHDGQLVDLGTLRSGDEGNAFALGTNDSGYIVGGSDIDYTSQETRAFLWHRGRMHNLGKPPDTTGTFAYAINNLGQVVGVAGRNAPRGVGFIWDPDRGMHRLNDLLPAQCRWRTDFATDINDAGQISGTGYQANDPDTSTAFLMTPVFSTMGLAAPVPGAAGVTNTISVSNVTPGARIDFFYSRHGGGTIIPGCDLQQNALQLDHPTVIGSAIADGNGVASITRNVPLIARGQTVLFQAVVQSECAISQLVVHQFD